MHILYNRHHEDFLSKNASKWVAATQGIGNVAPRHPMLLHTVQTIQIAESFLLRHTHCPRRERTERSQLTTKHTYGCRVIGQGTEINYTFWRL
jgi:hypothetical protein